MMKTYRPKGYILKKCILELINGTQVDCSNIMALFVLNESIFENTFKANIVLMDYDGDFFENYPLYGDERFFIEFSTDDTGSTEDISCEFVITKITPSDKNRTDDKGTAYKSYNLSLVPPDFALSLSEKISTSYEKLPVEQIIADICDNYFSLTDKIVNIETTTKVTETIVIPYLPPLLVINWLKDIAVPETGTNDPCLFFEDKNEYRFVSMRQLMQQKPVLDYDYSSNILDNTITANNNNNNNNKGLRGQIISYNIISPTADLLDKLMNGEYGSNIFSLDTLSKSYRTQEVTYSELFDLMEHTDKETTPVSIGKSYSTQALRHTIITKTHRQELEYVNEKNSDDHSLKLEELAPYKHVMQKLYNTIEVDMSVIGDSNLTCGMTINCNFDPTVANQKVSDKNSSALTGTYLIKAITHTLSGDGEYNQYLKLIRDGFRR